LFKAYFSNVPLPTGRAGHCLRTFKTGKYPCNNPWKPLGQGSHIFQAIVLQVDSLVRLPRFIPRIISRNTFLLDYVDPRAIVRLEGTGKLKKFIHLIRTRTRDLPACSIALQPSTLQHAPNNNNNNSFVPVVTEHMVIRNA
jgi:hypothetical protein